MNEIFDAIKQVFDFKGGVIGASGAAVHESYEFSKVIKSRKKLNARVYVLIPIGVCAGLLIGAVLGKVLESEDKYLYIFLCGIAWKPFASNSKQFFRIVLKAILETTADRDNEKKGAE